MCVPLLVYSSVVQVITRGARFHKILNQKVAILLFFFKYIVKVLADPPADCLAIKDLLLLHLPPST